VGKTERGRRSYRRQRDAVPRGCTFLEAEKNYRDGRTAYQYEKLKEAVHHFIVAQARYRMASRIRCQSKIAKVGKIIHYFYEGWADVLVAEAEAFIKQKQYTAAVKRYEEEAEKDPRRKKTIDSRIDRINERKRVTE